MKKITDVKRQKDKKRVNLFVDGAFYSGVEEIVLLSNNLHIGDEVDEKKLAEIIEESEYTSCFQKASNYILKGNHTVKQVCGYLKDKGYDGRIIAKVAYKLCDYGYLDDAAYAKNYVELKCGSKGKRLLEIELKQKGVSEENVQNALSDIADEDENAYKVAKKYLRRKPFTDTTKQKCFRYVVSKGFSYDSAKNALEKIERETIES